MNTQPLKLIEPLVGDVIRIIASENNTMHCYPENTLCHITNVYSGIDDDCVFYSGESLYELPIYGKLQQLLCREDFEVVL